MANVLEQAAEALRDRIDSQHEQRVSAALGCAVRIIRRVEELGISHPVFAVPVEYLEAAQMLGLRAEAI